MGYQIAIAETEKQKLKIPDDIWERTKDISFYCVFHWLDCLYQDFLDEKIREEMPCNSCPEVMNCKTSPLETFNLASRMFGLEMKSIRPKHRKSKSQ